MSDYVAQDNWANPGGAGASSSGSGSGSGGLIGGGIAGLISAPFNILGSLSEQQKMNQMIQAELARQKAYQLTGQGILSGHLDENTLGAVNKDIKSGAGAAMKGYENAPMIAQPGHAQLPTLGASFMSPMTVGAEHQSNQAGAQMQGYTDWSVKQALENLKARTKLLQNNQFAKQSESVLPTELSAAQNSQSGLKAFGSLLGDVGGVAAMAAM